MKEYTIVGHHETTGPNYITVARGNDANEALQNALRYEKVRRGEIPKDLVIVAVFEGNISRDEQEIMDFPMMAEELYHG